jgi:hypothetical protein
MGGTGLEPVTPQLVEPNRSRHPASPCTRIPFPWLKQGWRGARGYPGLRVERLLRLLLSAAQSRLRPPACEAGTRAGHASADRPELYGAGAMPTLRELEEVLANQPPDET